MKTLIMAICLTVSGAMVAGAQTSTPAIIPKPEKLEMRTGFFTLEHGVKIDADKESTPTAKFLAERLRKGMGFAGSKSKNTTGVIQLSIDGPINGLGAEGYSLT